MHPPAWIEPGTASLCLYCTTLLFRGRTGMRTLLRQMRREREAVVDVTIEEFSDFLCDHPILLLTIILVSGSLLTEPFGTPRCRLVSRAPALMHSTRTLLRSASKTVSFGVSDGISKASIFAGASGLTRIYKKTNSSSTSC